MEDIEHCDQLLTLSLCNNATTGIYPSLQGDGMNNYPCKWDVIILTCQNRVEKNEEDILTQNKLSVAVTIVIVIFFIVVVLLIVVIVILFRWRVKFKDPQLNSSVDPTKIENF
jgi:hypothetical protein